jgi:hypothetical protein
MQKVVFDGLQSNITVRELVFGKHGERVAFVLFDGKSCRIRFGERETAAFDMCEHLTTDRECKTVAYKIRQERNWSVGVNDARGPGFSWISDPVVSSDGRNVAYFADNGNEFLLILNDQTLETFPAPGHVVFTADGRLAFSVQVPGQSIMSVGGARRGPFEAVSPPFCAPVGNDVCFWARREGRWLLFRDFELIDQAEIMTIDPGVQWNRQGTSIGYWIQRDGRWLVGIDGLAQPAIGEPVGWVGGPIVSECGRVGYGARLGKSVCAVVDGQGGELYDAIGRIIFSPDGRTYAHKAQRDAREFVVVEGKAGPGFDMFSHDVFGEPGTLDDIPSFAPDGKLVASIAYKAGQGHVATNGSLHGPFFAISAGPVFSPRGTLVFCATRRVPGQRRVQEFVVAGDQEIGPFDIVWNVQSEQLLPIVPKPFVNQETGSLRFVAVLEGKIVIYEIVI